MNSYCYLLLAILLLIVTFGEMAPTRKGMAAAKDNKGNGDHSYNKTQQHKQDENQASGVSETDICKKCKKNLKKNIKCGFCDHIYCYQCSELEKPAFEAFSAASSVAWYCLHCINAVPGVSKVLVRLGNVEAQCQSLGERVTKIEANEMASEEKIKQLAREEIDEMREIEGRRLNLMVFNMPESKKDDVKDRQLEDAEFLHNVLEQIMNLDMSETEVIKPIRVGRRQIVNGAIKNKRPLRFTVKDFSAKRNILKANTYLRESKDEIFSVIYFTPDLTKKQREEAFELRQMKRYRTNVLHEKNLKISRGKIVQVSDPENPEDEGEVADGLDPGEH